MSVSLAATSLSRLGPPAQPRDTDADALVLRVMTTDLLLVVATQKAAFHLGGAPENQIAVAFPIHFACIAYLALRGRIRIPAMRLVAFSAFASLVALSQVPAVSWSFSLSSMVLMLSISAMLVFVVPMSAAGYRRLLNRFALAALAAALLVGVDWLAQWAGLAMPSLDAVIPDSMVYYKYNYIQPLQWDSPWMKPNGLFFLEASHASQFIGMGLVIELAFFRRFSILAVLGTSVLASFGGTGLLLVLSSLPFLLARARPAIIIAVAALAPLLGFVAYESGLLDSFLRRTVEFSQDSSSGYNRFVLPMEWSAASLTGPSDQALLGTGAGSMPKAFNDDAAGTAGYAWPPYTKVDVEYGAIVLVVWLLLLGISLFGNGTPLVVAWVVFVQYNFLNGSLNVPIHTIYCVLLCAGCAVDSQQRARARPFPLPRRLNLNPIINDYRS